MRNITIGLTLLAGLTGHGQDQNSSPYTRFGIGEQVSFMSTPFIGMGGASVSLADSRHINFSNPATYGTMRRYNPVFDAGIMGKSSFMKTDSTSQNQTTVSLRDFALMMPVSQKTGVVFGLMPYSTTGYDVNTYDPNEGDTITYNYGGMGSVNRLFIGLGQQLINKGDTARLSIGVNSSFLFGTIQRDRRILFNDASYYNTRLIDKTIIRGFTFDLGLHYYEKINKKLYYQLGITSTFGNKVRAYKDFYAYTYKVNEITQAEVSKDTAAYSEDIKGYLILPRKLVFGASITYNNKLTVSAQFELADWQNYYEWFDSVETRYNELSQMRKFSVGMEYQPNVGISGKNISTFKLMSYKLGGYYGYAPYRINDTNLKQYGIAFGITMPLLSSNSSSSMSLGFELGKMGTTEKGLIQDNYFKFNLGFSLSPNAKFDKWFWKRLYD